MADAMAPESDSESDHMFNSESHDGDESGTLAGKVQSDSFEWFGSVLYCKRRRHCSLEFVKSSTISILSSA